MHLQNYAKVRAPETRAHSSEFMICNLQVKVAGMGLCLGTCSGASFDQVLRRSTLVKGLADRTLNLKFVSMSYIYQPTSNSTRLESSHRAELASSIDKIDEAPKAMRRTFVSVRS